jgi:hypothetical protein
VGVSGRPALRSDLSDAIESLGERSTPEPITNSTADGARWGREIASRGGPGGVVARHNSRGRSDAREHTDPRRHRRRERKGSHDLRSIGTSG